MRKNEMLLANVRAARQAMKVKGWSKHDAGRDEPSFESVCYVALDALSRCDLTRLSVKASAEISLLIEYLLKFHVHPKGRNPAVGFTDHRACLCGTSLFTCASALSSGGTWNGITEISLGDCEPAPTLDDWNEAHSIFGRTWVTLVSKISLVR